MFYNDCTSHIIEQLLLDARVSVEGAIQDGAENYTETPLQLASAAGTIKHPIDRVPKMCSDTETTQKMCQIKMSNQVVSANIELNNKTVFNSKLFYWEVSSHQVQTV